MAAKVTRSEYIRFFFWGVLKTYVYEKYPDSPQSIEEVNARISEALASITPDMIHRAQQNIIKRAKCCLAQEGGLFEHLLRDFDDE